MNDGVNLHALDLGGMLPHSVRISIEGAGLGNVDRGCGLPKHGDDYHDGAAEDDAVHRIEHGEFPDHATALRGQSDDSVNGRYGK